MTRSELIEKTRQFLRGRQQAYRTVFAPGVARDTVMADLAKFCRANKSTGHADPHVAARLDGRREVFLRITQHLHMSEDELYRLLGGVE
jgi:hypothetical protein